MGRPSKQARKATIDGVTDSYVAHAARLGIDPALVRNRLATGWEMEKALTAPKVPYGSWAQSEEGRASISARVKGKPANISPEKLKARNLKIAEANRTRVITDEHRANASAAHLARGLGKKHLVMGEMLTAVEVSRKYPVSRHTFNKRVQAGWSPDEAASKQVRRHER